ncbi:MAG: lysophospholipid acyltransferase family protein [Muribaculaceae bacterium]|nr:lysophospholipid acyltransferase family protein [Muribaculaceae bacterium]
MRDYSQYEIKPDVLAYDDIRQMIPALDGHPKITEALLKFLEVDKVNRVHRNCCDTPGPEFTRRLLFDEFKLTLKIDGQEVLDNLPEGAFITVSNHPFGALDGIMLIYLIGQYRPEFRVMVNMILNKITAMRPNFIAVDAWASNDPAKRAVSVRGIREVLKQLKEGEPVGFFPAGAMSKTTLHDGLQDRPWQPSVLQIIHRAKVPVIPIFFHGSNSWLCNLMGHICWPVRSIMLPHEVFRKVGSTMHVSVGQPISVEEQALHSATPEELGAYLRKKTYELRDIYK